MGLGVTVFDGGDRGLLRVRVSSSCTLLVQQAQKEGACRLQQQEREEGVCGIGRVVAGVVVAGCVGQGFGGIVLVREGRVVCVCL
jgi:hypothetical protein